MDKFPKDCKISQQIYNYFQKKFCLGYLGLFECVSVASIKTLNIKPISILVISPSGHFKSSVMNDILIMFPNETKLMPSWFTDYGIVKEFSEAELNNRIWCFNDLVSTFGSLSQSKANRVASFLAELLSEGYTATATYRGRKELRLRIGLIGNIARDMWRKKKVDFLINTFRERILEFHYELDWDNVKTDRSLKPFQINIKENSVEIPKKFHKIIKSKAKELEQIRRSSSRPRNSDYIESFLCSHANLNGRNKVTRSDLTVFNKILEFIGSIKRRLPTHHIHLVT